MNPYKIPAPALISFSGGRTSGFMLWNILQAYKGKLPDDVRVCFANTGREIEQTLSFVNNCSEHWDIKIHWLELEIADERPVYRTKEVDYESASRNGEPFENLIDRKKYLPNPAKRFCTEELKINVFKRFMQEKYDSWFNVVGLRYDEPRRVANVKKRNNEQQKWITIAPMYDARHSISHVNNFWNKQNFDLQLVNMNGRNPFGNCDLCFLKNLSHTTTVMRQRPDLAEWWIKQENKLQSKFRADQRGFIDLLDISKTQKDFFDDGTGVDCFCHD